MNIGIICEYNPFHYGHLYHINKIKQMFKNCNIILVMSGNITEKGDLSLINKWDKTSIALKYGVDLVVELPYKYIQSADYFARGCIEILNKLNCKYIVFGSENNNTIDLTEMAKTQIYNKEYNKLVKKFLNNNYNYPTALSKSLNVLCNKTVNTPNDILGLSYIREILKNKYDIEPISIKRTNNYNSKKIEGKITSATSIRNLISNKKRFKKYVPSYSYKLLKNCIFLDDYFDYLKYKIISENNLTIYQDIDIKINNRIKKVINESNNIDELIKNIKTKNYTYNRLKRILVYILFSLKKEEYTNLSLNYIRVLGFNKKGQKLLSVIKKEINIPLLTTYNPDYLKKDLNIVTILSLNKKIRNKKNYIEKEYKNKPIIL